MIGSIFFLRLKATLMNDMTSLDLFDGSQALMGLSYAVSLIKPAICWAGTLMSLWDNLNVSKNAAFASEAPVRLANGHELQTRWHSSRSGAPTRGVRRPRSEARRGY